MSSFSSSANQAPAPRRGLRVPAAQAAAAAAAQAKLPATVEPLPADYFERIVFYYPEEFTRVVVDTKLGLSPEEDKMIEDALTNQVYCRTLHDYPVLQKELETETKRMAKENENDQIQVWYFNGVTPQYALDHFTGVEGKMNDPALIMYSECPCSDIHGSPLTLDDANKEKLWNKMQHLNPRHQYDRTNSNPKYVNKRIDCDNSRSSKKFNDCIAALMQMIKSDQDEEYKKASEKDYTPTHRNINPVVTGLVVFETNSNPFPSSSQPDSTALEISLICSPYRHAKFLLRSTEVLARLMGHSAITLEAIQIAIPNYTNMGFQVATTKPKDLSLTPMSKDISTLDAYVHLVSPINPNANANPFQNAIMANFKRSYPVVFYSDAVKVPRVVWDAKKLRALNKNMYNSPSNPLTFKPSNLLRNTITPAPAPAPALNPFAFGMYDAELNIEPITVDNLGRMVQQRMRETRKRARSQYQQDHADDGNGNDPSQFPTNLTFFGSDAMDEIVRAGTTNPTVHEPPDRCRTPENSPPHKYGLM